MSTTPWAEFKETRDLNRPMVHFIRGKNDRIPRVIREIPFTHRRESGQRFVNAQIFHPDGSIQVSQINESNVERCSPDSFFSIQQRAINTYERRTGNA